MNFAGGINNTGSMSLTGTGAYNLTASQSITGNSAILLGGIVNIGVNTVTNQNTGIITINNQFDAPGHGSTM